MVSLGLETRPGREEGGTALFLTPCLLQAVILGGPTARAGAASGTGQGPLEIISFSCSAALCFVALHVPSPAAKLLAPTWQETGQGEVLLSPIPPPAALGGPVPPGASLAADIPKDL